ncbi:MAG: NAD(+)/NADH kinase [Methanobrevibacter thaueri]|uniref:NAD kinase n=1 Tax=Methanobrevibacter thaueri TaxID=190975 RepID=A0A8T3V8C9_9EURY|nr:NAD(+)/NADH kinase [Methanobrevibacter thaueri]MBE6501916.1 NAD(+)/NADH kinase [Methanobrevibacter thaueri]
MKIFINADDFTKIALKTKEELVNCCEERDIEVASDISQADILFSIGGDGTFLNTAKMTDKPIIGINTGTLGYLTEVNPSDMKKALENILNDNYTIENRMMVEGKILKANGDEIKISESLNEIAISKNVNGVVRFDAIVNDKLITSYIADGILVCTPTGSTAYNLSCGGPIVDPTAEILTLTPIAPHTVLNKSIVLSKKSNIKIKITELRENTSAYVLNDGIPNKLESGDIVEIEKSDKITKIIKLEDRSFIDTIRENIS